MKKTHLTQPVSIRFPKKRIEHLKQIARKVSVKRKSNVSYADIIREAVDKVHPQK